VKLFTSKENEQSYIHDDDDDDNYYYYYYYYYYFLKRVKVNTKQNTGNTMENEIKELESMKAYKYLSVEKSHNTPD
jgi:hypothetical protein